MKTKILTIALIGVLATPAIANSNVVKRCTNDETSVVLKQLTSENFQALVSVESAGGSHPTFKFNQIAKEDANAEAPNATLQFVGKGFELAVQLTSQGEIGHLTVPSLGIEREKLRCF